MDENSMFCFSLKNGFYKMLYMICGYLELKLHGHILQTPETYYIW